MEMGIHCAVVHSATGHLSIACGQQDGIPRRAEPKGLYLMTEGQEDTRIAVYTRVSTHAHHSTFHKD